MTGATTPADAAVAALWRARPRNRFVRMSLWLFGALLLGAWFVGDFEFARTFSDAHARNVERFLSEARPYPLRESQADGTLRDLPWDWGVFGTWAGERLAHGVSDSDRDTPSGIDGALGTLAISVLAIVLASLASLVLCWFAARNVATPQPFAPTATAPGVLHRWAWRFVVGGTRLFLILQRSMPEYILAFLLFWILRTPAWPARPGARDPQCGHSRASQRRDHRERRIEVPPGAARPRRPPRRDRGRRHRAGRAPALPDVLLLSLGDLRA